jgi:WD40 repeat protein
MERRLLTLSAYEKLGEEASKIHPSGLAVAIAAHANGTFQKLSEEQQKIARRIFIRLVQFGEGRADTRRQQTKKELQSTKDDPQQFEDTLKHLVNNRLLTPTSSEDDKDKEAKIDIAHETLIKSWPNFQQWLADWRTKEEIRRRWQSKVDEWERLKRKAGLLDEAELKEAEDWLKSADAIELGYDSSLCDLVAKSRKLINRKRQILWLTTVCVILLVAIISGLGYRTQQINKIQIVRDLIKKSQCLQKDKDDENKSGFYDLPIASLLVTQEYLKQLNSIRKYYIPFLSVEDLNNDKPNDEHNVDNQVYKDVINVFNSIPLPKYVVSREESKIARAEFTPDGKYLVTGDDSGTVRILNAETSEQLNEYSHQAKVTTLVFNQSNNLLASAAEDGSIKIWNFNNNKLITSLPFNNQSEDKGAVTTACFTPNGDTLVTGHENGALSFWNSQNNWQKQQIKPHEAPVNTIICDSQSKLVFSASDDGTIKRFEVSSQEILPLYIFILGAIVISRSIDHLYLSHNSQSLVYSAPEMGSEIIFDNQNLNSRGVRFMCPTQWSLHGILIPHEDKSKIVNGTVLALCPQSEAMVRITEAQEMLLFSLGWSVDWLNEQKYPVKEASVFPNSQGVMTLNTDGIIKLYYCEKEEFSGSFLGECLKKSSHSLLLKSGTQTITASFSQNGKLVTVDADGKARVWNIDNLYPLSKPLRNFDHYGERLKLENLIKLIDEKLKSLKVTESERINPSLIYCQEF